MGLEHLLDALERDATAQVEQLLARARADADQRTAAASEALERRRQDAHARLERSRHQDVEHAVALARRGARRSVLEARERFLERVFTAARAELAAAAAGPAYRASLPGALARALAAVGNETAVIRCPEALVADLRRLTPNGRASVVVDESTGSGFVLATKDGAVEVDDTLEARLEHLRPALARHILSQLELAP
jgi:vacuolar-type H+-ATPase subunit E/Vma4